MKKEITSSKPVLENPHRPWKTAAFSKYPRGERMGYSMGTHRYRLTRWVHRQDHSKVDAVEFYDHQTNPQENTNLAMNPENKALVEKLTRQWLDGWQGAKP
jgi:iduronate 2-sulfatase